MWEARIGTRLPRGLGTSTTNLVLPTGNPVGKSGPDGSRTSEEMNPANNTVVLGWSLSDELVSEQQTLRENPVRDSRIDLKVLTEVDSRGISLSLQTVGTQARVGFGRSPHG